MEYPHSTINEIIESENRMALNSSERFGKYYEHAMKANALLSNFLESVNPDQHLFVIFLSQIRKHIVLAILSTFRLHKIQAMMDLRQVIEAGSCAAFAIANPDISGFADIDEDGIMDSGKDLAVRRYKWLDENFQDGSKAIKHMKDSINESTAHSNIAYAMQNFSLDTSKKKFNTPYFDAEDDYHIQSDLWMIGNIAHNLMDLFYGVNRGKNVVKFKTDFAKEIKELRGENDSLKQEMMDSVRFKKSVELKRK